jgi:hypothetical protein
MYTYIKYTYSHREGGRVEPGRTGEGQQREYRSQSWGVNTNMTENTREISYLQSITLIKPAEKSLYW